MEINKHKAKTCRDCGQDNSPSSQFCTNCGLPFKVPKPVEPEPVYCNNCGSKNNPSAQYCAHCGYDIGNDATSASLDVNAQEINAAPVNEAKKVGWRDWLGRAAAVIAFIVAFAVVRGLFSGGASSLSDDWVPFASTDGYSVDMPGTPEKSTEQINLDGNSMPVTSYSVSSSSEAYTAMAITYPASVDLSNAENSLQGAVEGSVAKITGGRIVSNTDVTISGLPGKAVVINGDDNVVVYQTAALDVNSRTLYYFGQVATSGEQLQQKYFDSIRIVPKVE